MQSESFKQVRFAIWVYVYIIPGFPLNNDSYIIICQQILDGKMTLGIFRVYTHFIPILLVRTLRHTKSARVMQSVSSRAIIHRLYNLLAFSLSSLEQQYSTFVFSGYLYPLKIYWGFQKAFVYVGYIYQHLLCYKLRLLKQFVNTF